MLLRLSRQWYPLLPLSFLSLQVFVISNKLGFALSTYYFVGLFRESAATTIKEKEGGGEKRRKEGWKEGRKDKCFQKHRK